MASPDGGPASSGAAPGARDAGTVPECLPLRPDRNRNGGHSMATATTSATNLAGNERVQEIYLGALRNTHALLKQAEDMIERQVERYEQYPELTAALRQHRDEIPAQIAQFERIMESHGTSAVHLQGHRHPDGRQHRRRDPLARHRRGPEEHLHRPRPGAARGRGLHLAHRHRGGGRRREERVHLRAIPPDPRAGGAEDPGSGAPGDDALHPDRGAGRRGVGEELTRPCRHRDRPQAEDPLILGHGSPASGRGPLGR